MNGDERYGEALAELEAERANAVALRARIHDVIAALAHDIKGPLTSITGFAELLEEGYVEGDGARDAAKTIRTNAERLAKLADDVLALSRSEAGELDLADDRVDVTDAMRGAIGDCAASERVRLTAGGPAFVRGDRERLREAFRAVVDNAVRFSPNAAPVEISILRDGDWISMSVRDHGIGIAPEDVTRVFERFARGANARRAKLSGTGVGLFVASAIVQQHGGSVTVSSALDSGSDFIVRLPCFESTTTRPALRAAIVGTDRNLRRFVACELRSRRYRVIEVETAAELSGRDVRAGDAILADAAQTTAGSIREAAAPATIRVIGIGADEGGWDAVLPRTFLVKELIAALETDGNRSAAGETVN